MIIDVLVAGGFEETACSTEADGSIAHAQLDWPEGGGVMLGSHRPDGDLVQQPGTSAAHVVTAHVGAVVARARAAGADVPGGVREPDDGGREVTVRDAEGNRWTFGTYPGEPRRGGRRRRLPPSGGR
jgi:uncharacterized glyoxalase superfamily protein PhnB